MEKQQEAGDEDGVEEQRSAMVRQVGVKDLKMKETLRGRERCRGGGGANIKHKRS